MRAVVRRPPPVPALLLGVALWGVFATLAVYVLDSIAQTVGMMSGVMGSASQIDGGRYRLP